MSSRRRAGFTQVELLMTIAVMGLIATAAGAVLTMSIDAHDKGSSRVDMQRDGMLAMERITSGLQRATFLLIPNHHDPVRGRISFSGLVNDDGDYYFDDPLFPRYDEDLSDDTNEDGFNGIWGVDDDGDGSTDEKSGWMWTGRNTFDTVSFANDGPDWYAPDLGWEERIENDGPTAGLIQIAAGPGLETYALRMGGEIQNLDGVLMERTFDTSSTLADWLSFRYTTSGQPGGEVTLSIRKPGGSWTDLATYEVGGVHTTRVEALHITAFDAWGTQLRFTGSGTTGAGGYIYFDDLQLRSLYAGAGSTVIDDDEDGEKDEDPVDGIDNDMDGNIDEDPSIDSNGDGLPGIGGMDDDGDGFVDEGDWWDDDEDGSFAEAGLLPVTYFRNNAAQELREYDSYSGGTAVLAHNVTLFQVIRESPARVRIQLELTGADGYVARFEEVVCLRNVYQKTGKRVR